MSIPEGALVSSESYFSSIMSMSSSAATTVVSAGKTCFSTAINGVAFLASNGYAAVKQGFTFTASLCSANPRITKAAIGAIILAGAAYAGRGYCPTLKGMISK